MRTTIDIPDPVFRRLKAAAALRGTSMKALILAALEREIPTSTTAPADEPFPVVRSDQPGGVHLDSTRIAEILEQDDVRGAP